MSDPFVGEIRIFGCNFAPTGWAQCNGQLMPIAQNTALFSLLGTFYGGDGRSTFALPNLQGSAPLNMGQGPGLTPRVLGETGGEPTVTLLASEMPLHSHTLNCVDAAGDQNTPANETWAIAHISKNKVPIYCDAKGGGSAMNSAALQTLGRSQAHNNMPPYLTLNFCIALQGIFPARQ